MRIKIGDFWSSLELLMMNANSHFSFWYIEVSAYNVYSLVYICRSLLEQEIELVLMFLFPL